jgi:hypothetical protein
MGYGPSLMGLKEITFFWAGASIFGIDSLIKKAFT